MKSGYGLLLAGWLNGAASLVLAAPPSTNVMAAQARSRFEVMGRTIEYRVSQVYCLLADKYGEEITYSVGSVVEGMQGRMKCARVFASLTSGKTIAVWMPEY